ncbi:MAG: heparan-alpha-glucosaminide N-acetyltransferase [Enterobacterales bacterium]|nr:heparan-alpha-glucosaminide N-acetyltransferase [Enterobacterales bacterium]
MNINKELSLKPQRFALLDFVRGMAILLMFIFHLAFGLSQINLLDIHMASSPFWVGFRFIIVFLFLTLVGIGLILASKKQYFYQAFFKRLALLALYAGLISLFSYSVRTYSYVFFGILHLILVASLVCLLFLRFYYLNLLLAIFALMMNWIKFSWFDDKHYFIWLGLSHNRPITDDFAPLLPWIGFVFLGLFMGRFLFEKNSFPYLSDWTARNFITRLITWGGRYSIHLYFVHFQFFYFLVWFFN